MANFSDLIGAFMQNATAPSGQQRMGNALEDLLRTGMASLGVGAQAGAPGANPGAGPAGSLGDLLGQVLGAAKGGLSNAVQNPGQAGGIGAILGGLLGGGGDSVKGALGGGALAVLASIAFKALQGAGQAESGAPGINLPGLTAPETPEQEQAVEATAQLMLKGMISAAKADGQIDQTEMQRIVGKLQEVGMDEETQAWVLNEMRQPLDLDALVAEIPNQQAAAQVYAASLLAIEVDTDAERSYLAQLAQKTQMHPQVAQQIHQNHGHRRLTLGPGPDPPGRALPQPIASTRSKRAAKVGKIPPDGARIHNLGGRGGLTFREFNELSPSERKQRERERWGLRTANAGAASSLAPGQGKLDQ